MASAAFVAIPSVKETRIDPQPFRLLFLCRLRLPLPLQARSCRCGRPLDVLGHHRVPCADAGVLGRRGWVLENVAARVCRGEGGRVRTNLVVRDMDLGAQVHLDGRRPEIVVDGLPLCSKKRRYSVNWEDQSRSTLTEKWKTEEHELMIDSGCFGHVCPPWFAPQFPMVSSANVDAVAANNVALQHYGQNVVYGHVTTNSGRDEF